MREVFIVSMARTPIGAFNGSLASVDVLDLGTTVVKAAVERAGIAPKQVDEVILGNVLTANVGQAPAKQVALKAGFDVNTPCTTINKVCASGMKSIMMAAQSILAGDNECVVAGGMESMSRAPFYLPKGRTGMRYGNGEILDAIVRDGLQDPYEGYMMGNVAEICADKYKFSREDQDAYAVESYKRAANAIKRGYYDEEIVPVTIPQRRGEPVVVSEDDEPKRFNKKKVSTVRSAFMKNGTVTAINASKINDGAAAVVLMSGEMVEKTGATPLVKVLSYADASQAPEWFTTTPAKAIPKAIKKAGLKAEDVKYYEINEAFSVVSMANNHLLKLDPKKVNVFGGAVSLGHPIGASGARILCTLISVLRKKKGKIGCAGICNGGGGASAMVLQRV